MVARATLHLQTNKHLSHDDVRWGVQQALEQINDYIYSNAHWHVWWRDYVRDQYGRYVNALNDLRGNVYISSHYNRSRVELYKGSCLHEFAHNWYWGHHNQPGMLGRGGVGPFTFTPADFAVMRPRRKPGPAPWEDPRNFPEVVADTFVCEPGWYGYVDVLTNDRQARGWALAFNGNRAISSDPRVETAAIGGVGIKVVTYPEFRECTIRYQVRHEMGSDSATWAKLKVVAAPPEYAWTNPDNPYDVNADGRVSALDALNIINFGSMPVDPTRPALDSQGRRIYPDVTGDDRVSSLDALRVINEL